MAEAPELMPESRVKVSWINRLRAFRQEMGPFWWHTILIFAASRIADIANLYVGVFYLPAALSQGELGAVDPVTRLAGFAAIPMAIISVVGAKYISTYLARNERGKIKQFMRDMALLGLASAVVFSLVLVATFESFRVRLGLDNRFILPALCALGVLSCWQPLVQVVLQGMQKFYTVAFMGVGGNLLRVVLVLCLVPLLHLSGYLFATFISGVVVVALSIWSLKPYIARNVSSAPYYAEWRGILAFAWPITIMTCVATVQSFVEPFVVKHFLHEKDAAGYYMICRFGSIPNFLVGAIGFVLFPLMSSKHERGEDTGGYLSQALGAALLVSGGGTLVLGVSSGWLFNLLPQWRPFVGYTPLIWFIGLQVTLDAAISIYSTHEIACRRFGFLRVIVPVAILDVIILYGSFGWGAFHGWLPDGLWSVVDQTIPRTLTYAVAVMCSTRLLAAAGLLLTERRHHCSEAAK